MALETATTVDELNPSNPTAGDPKSQGDDHVRMLKVCVQASAFGIGQSWTTVTGSRAINTEYTNSADKPIVVSASIFGNTASSTVAIAWTVSGVTDIDSTAVIASSTPSNTKISATTIVPPGATYQLVVTQGTLAAWAELR